MRLFKHTATGIVISVGFDMLERVPNPKVLCWSDVNGHTWDFSNTNQSGNRSFPFDLNPEFIRQTNDGFVMYQPGLCIKATYLGYPMAWGFQILQPEC